MKLNKKQKAFLLERVAEGLETGEINKLASEFKPPFEVSRSQVDHYRQTRKVSISQIKEEDENSALKTGLSLKENRVKLLHELAEKLKNDLFNDGLLWTDNAKGIGSGPLWEKYDYKEFNAAEVAQLRGVLEDIASEVGDRAKRQEITGKDGEKLSMRLDLNDLPTALLQELASGEAPMKVLMRYVLSGRKD